MNTQMIINSFLKDVLIGLIEREEKDSRGRKNSMPIDHYLDIIILVLTTGCQWENVSLFKEAKLHYTTYFRKFVRWSGIFEEAFVFLCRTKQLLEQIGSNFFIDSSAIRNLKGEDLTGYNYKFKSKKSTKMTILVNEQGIPVSVHFSNSTVHDVKLVQPTIKNAGIPLSRIKRIGGDKGYQSKGIREELVKSDISYIYVPKRSEKTQLSASDQIFLSRRWVVERTFGWIYQYRRIVNRYERRIENYRSFVLLAISNIIANKVLNN